MYEAACGFAEKVYPDIDKDWLRKECGNSLLQDRYAIFRVDGGFGRRLRWKLDVIGLEVTFPSHDLFLLNATGHLRGLCQKNWKSR